MASGNPVSEFLAHLKRGDLSAANSMVSKDASWSVVGPATIPYAGTTHGPDCALKFFELCGEHEELVSMSFDEPQGAAPLYVVTGLERTKVKATGKVFEAGFAWIFSVEEGLINSFVEYIDTAPMVEAYRS